MDYPISSSHVYLLYDRANVLPITLKNFSMTFLLYKKKKGSSEKY